MKARTESKGYDMYFRANLSRGRRKTAGASRHGVKVHTK